MKKGSISALMIVLLVSMVAVIGLIGPTSLTGMLTKDECEAIYDPIEDKLKIESRACKKGFIVEATFDASLTDDFCEEQRDDAKDKCNDLSGAERRTCKNLVNVVQKACKKQFHLLVTAGSITRQECNDIYKPQQNKVRIEERACKKGFDVKAVQDTSLNRQFCRQQYSQDRSICNALSGDERRTCNNWAKIVNQACRKGFTLVLAGAPPPDQLSIELLSLVSFSNVNDPITTGELTTVMYKITNIVSDPILLKVDHDDIYATINSQQLTVCSLMMSNPPDTTVNDVDLGIVYVMAPGTYITITCTFQPQDVGELIFTTEAISKLYVPGADPIGTTYTLGGFYAVDPVDLLLALCIDQRDDACTAEQAALRACSVGWVNYCTTQPSALRACESQAQDDYDICLLGPDYVPPPPTPPNTDCEIQRVNRMAYCEDQTTQSWMQCNEDLREVYGRCVEPCANLEGFDRQVCIRSATRDLGVYSCDDRDGNDITRASTVVYSDAYVVGGLRPGTVMDSCVAGVVREFTCEGVDNLDLRMQEIPCPSGTSCVDGACIAP